MSKIDIKSFFDLKKSLEGEKLKEYKEIKDFQEYFDDMAKYIFGNVAIVIGNSHSKQIKYYLEEIEFYYNNNKIEEETITVKTKDGKKTANKNYFSCTYKRKSDAGKLFWHYSGVDICFQSDETCYGGILIRSMSKCDGDDNKPELIAGPLRCANEIANQSILLESTPHIDEIKGKRNISVNNIASTIRQGIENADRYKSELEKIRNNGTKKNSDFPFFCYYIKRGKDKWKIKVNNKPVNYSSIPENRNDIERSIP